MKAITLPILIIILSIGTANAGDTGDQVLASFDRAFNHQQAPQRAINREAVSADPLYTMISTALWTDEAGIMNSVPAYAGNTNDLVLASFGRM